MPDLPQDLLDLGPWDPGGPKSWGKKVTKSYSFQGLRSLHLHQVLCPLTPSGPLSGPLDLTLWGSCASIFWHLGPCISVWPRSLAKVNLALPKDFMWMNIFLTCIYLALAVRKFCSVCEWLSTKQNRTYTWIAPFYRHNYQTVL